MRFQAGGSDLFQPVVAGRFRRKHRSLVMLARWVSFFGYLIAVSALVWWLLVQSKAGGLLMAATLFPVLLAGVAILLGVFPMSHTRDIVVIGSKAAIPFAQSLSHFRREVDLDWIASCREETLGKGKDLRRVLIVKFKDGREFRFRAAPLEWFANEAGTSFLHWMMAQFN